MFLKHLRKNRPAVAEAVEGRVLLSGTPNLVGTFTSQPAPPATMASGEFAIASYTVQNTGTAASTSFVPIFYLEKDTPTPGVGGDVSLAAVNNTGTSSSTKTLAVGATATQTLAFALPQGLSGTYYLVGEFSLTNYFASPAINVNGQTPTLSAGFVSGTVPTTAAFGDTVTPALLLANAGTAEGAGQEVTNYFLATSNNPTQQLGNVPGVYFVGSSTETVDLMPGQSVIETPNLTLPNLAGLAPGTYYIVAQANEGASPIPDLVTNNPVAVSDAINVTAAAGGVPSNLVPSLTRTKLPASFISSEKTPKLATVTIQNTGTSVSNGSTQVALYLSTSPTLDSSATPVSGTTRKLRIPAGKSVTLQIRLGAIPPVANGTYYLLAQVIDPTGAAGAASSASTTTITAPFVALAASLATPSANAIKTGDTLSITNAGNVADTTILDYTLHLASDSAGSLDVGNPLPLHTPGKVTIGPGKTIRLHVTGWSKIAIGLPAGQYYLTVFVQDAQSNTSLAVTPIAVTIA